jgi:hypothetical protein
MAIQPDDEIVTVALKAFYQEQNIPKVFYSSWVKSDMSDALNAIDEYRSHPVIGRNAADVCQRPECQSFRAFFVRHLRELGPDCSVEPSP